VIVMVGVGDEAQIDAAVRRCAVVSAVDHAYIIALVNCSRGRAKATFRVPRNNLIKLFACLFTSDIQAGPRR
jgi:hypothetical protein